MCTCFRAKLLRPQMLCSLSYAQAERRCLETWDLLE